MVIGLSMKSRKYSHMQRRETQQGEKEATELHRDSVLQIEPHKDSMLRIETGGFL